MEVAYCKIMLNMLSNKVFYSIFMCSVTSSIIHVSRALKKCFLSGDYDKIVSNIKKLMQDPCSRFVFVVFCNVFVVALYLFF